MLYDEKIWMGQDYDGAEKLCILPEMVNRHGLITGATGTGKTITLKVMAESLSEMGVPVFLSDVKCDLAGMLLPGTETQDMAERKKYFGLDAAGFRYQGYPVEFWDVEGKGGLPLRTTISEFGPTLLARLLELSELQADILSIVFRIADEHQLLLLDTKDLRAMLQHVAEHSKEYSETYGNMSKQSLNAILRAVVALETEGGDRFFGEPAIDIHDFMVKGADGKGCINIMDARKTMQNPRIYSTFMLYMLSELFEQMPEVGDMAEPSMVFFFDEAHLLFEGAPKALIAKIEQVVKLIRSKGIGVYFISQNPADIPDTVLAQLGNKVQHALRAYTPAEKKRVHAAAQAFRANPAFDTEAVLEELGTGEALISFLDQDGRPQMVRRARILPPESKMGPVEESERTAAIKASALYQKYAEMIDRDSAYEYFKRKSGQEELERQEAKEAEEREKREAREQESMAKQEEKERKKKLATVKSVGRSTAGTLGREVGYAVGKELFGSSIGRRIGGNIGAALGRGILDTLLGR
ncbi:MAG: DUF853 family protein [Oribacterium sp.]|nr:DUF853 family protein [Oribacterium sp.]